MPQARTSVTVIYNSMTDENVSAFTAQEQNTSSLEGLFIENFDKLSCKLFNTISTQIFIKNEYPSDKEKRNCEHIIKLFHNQVSNLVLEQLQDIKKIDDAIIEAATTSLKTHTGLAPDPPATLNPSSRTPPCALSQKKS